MKDPIGEEVRNQKKIVTTQAKEKLEIVEAEHALAFFVTINIMVFHLTKITL